MKPVQVSRHKIKKSKSTSVLIIIMNFLKKNVSELSPVKNTPNEKKSIVQEKATPKYGLVQESIQQDLWWMDVHLFVLYVHKIIILLISFLWPPPGGACRSSSFFVALDLDQTAWDDFCYLTGPKFLVIIDQAVVFHLKFCFFWGTSGCMIIF